MQALLDPSEHFRLDANLNRSDRVKREALHVQSISYWAPANIGPYSQAVKVRSFITKKLSSYYHNSRKGITSS